MPPQEAREPDDGGQSRGSAMDGGMRLGTGPHPAPCRTPGFGCLQGIPVTALTRTNRRTPRAKGPDGDEGGRLERTLAKSSGAFEQDARAVSRLLVNQHKEPLSLEDWRPSGGSRQAPRSGVSLREAGISSGACADDLVWGL